MFQGRYVEAHVARVIGAQIPNTGTSPWDLYLPGERNLRIEVKSTAGGGSFKANALDKEVDLWVFVTHSHEGKTRRPHGFRYAVGTRTRLEKAFSGRHAIGGEELLSRLGVIADADALRSAIGRHQQRPGRRSGRQL